MSYKSAMRWCFLAEAGAPCRGKIKGIKFGDLMVKIAKFKKKTPIVILNSLKKLNI